MSHILGVVHELHEIQQITPTINPYTGEPRLFDAQLLLDGRPGRDSIHLDLSFMSWLVLGAKRLFERGVIGRDLDDVTRLTVATIRITALQAYASRHLGDALVQQFGQWSTKAAGLGYHADIVKLIHLADPADASQVKHEEIGRTVVRAARTLGKMRGNGVPALEELIERNYGALTNPAPLSLARLRALGKKNHNLASGPYTLCIYRPEQALCGGRGAADFRLCRPSECRNSAMTVAQRAKIELRRRQEAAMGTPLWRSANKIQDAMPEIQIEFAELADQELVRIIAEELDSYLSEALNEDNEQP